MSWLEVDLTFRSSSRPIKKTPTLTIETESGRDSVKYYLELPHIPDTPINPLGLVYDEDE